MKRSRDAETTDTPALGSNPLALAPDGAEPAPHDDPFLTALAALEARRRWAEDVLLSNDPAMPLPEAAEAGRAPAAETPPRAPVRPLRPLDEVPLPEPRDLYDRLTSDTLRRRIAALAPLLEGSAGYDPHGLSLETLRCGAPIFELLHKHYFRVQSEGHEHIPLSGPVVLVSNHAGLLPFDGAMIVSDVLLRLESPRLVRAVIERFVGRIPFVNVLMARMGQVIGRRATVRDLLRDEQPVLIFPEGATGALKPIHQRHRLQAFHPGFVREALRANAPIVPVAVIGSEDQSPILADLKPLARLLGLPGFPITPTFPWLGPAGLLPYPVRYRIVYGEPIDLGDAHRGGDPDDPRRLERLADRVRRRIQGLVNEHERRDGAPS